MSPLLWSLGSSFVDLALTNPRTAALSAAAAYYGGGYVVQEVSSMITRLLISPLAGVMRGVAKEVNDVFVDSIGDFLQKLADDEGGEKLAKSIAKKMGAGLKELAKETDGPTKDFLNRLTKNIGTGLKEMAKESGEASQILGKGVGEGMGDFLKKAGEGMAQAYNDVSAAASWSTLKTWAPTLATIGIIGTALPLVYKYTYKVLVYRIGKPALMLDSKTTRWYSPLTNLFWGSENNGKVRPIFKPELQAQVHEIIGSTKNIEKHGGYFENVLLYGPPGTGKTMIAKQIAEESGMDYYMTSAAEMAQYIKRGEHISEMNKLLDRAENSGRPAVLFFDEFEAIGRDRSLLNQAHLELQTALLKRTGEGNKRMMLVFATNRKDDLDTAIISRCAYKIHVDLPDQGEREKILALYANKFFSKEEQALFFTADKVQAIAQKIEGFSGRTIFQMMNSIHNKKFTTSDGKLTQAILDQKIDHFVAQEKEVKEIDTSARQIIRRTTDKKAGS